MVKRMHIMESQSSNRGGTDFPCYYDEKNDEYYEASWNTDYGFAFGYWPIDYYHTEYEFCVSNPYMMHSNACGIAAREYFENYLDSEISDESTSLEDALYDLMNDFKEYGYSYDDESGYYVSSDGSDEFDLDGKVDELMDNNSFYYINRDYIFECVEECLEHMDYRDSERIKDDVMSSYLNEYDFSDKEGINEALELLGSSFDSFFEDGYGEGRIFPYSNILSFYITEQPSSKELDSIVRDLSNCSKIDLSYDDILDFKIIYEDWDNNYEVNCCSVREYIDGTFGKEDADEDEDDDDYSEIQYSRDGKTRFIPHLANANDKREYFKSFRDTRDRALYAPIERGVGSLARYNALRHPYGEGIERKGISDIISEVINRFINERCKLI